MRVIVESPFAGSFQNVRYSRECIRDSLDRGESPFASHLLYTQKGILDDKIPVERMRGINAAAGWLQVADFVAVYMDLGITSGMVWGIVRAARLGKEVHLRWLRPDRREQVIRIEDDAINKDSRANSSDNAAVRDREIMALQRFGLLRDNRGFECTETSTDRND